MEPDKTDLKITCSKEFSAPVGRLYAAWTEEDALKQWWRPMGNTLQHAASDIRPGGEVRYVFTAAGDAPSIEISGEYSVAEPEKKLEYTWNWKLPDEQAVGDADFMLSIGFEEAGSGSRLHVVQTGFTDQESLRPHQEGWESGLEDLKKYLEDHRDAAAGTDSAEAAL